jgi:hypothetical protein
VGLTAHQFTEISQSATQTASEFSVRSKEGDSQPIIKRSGEEGQPIVKLQVKYYSHTREIEN